jgi:predicted aspartyl protease
MVDLTEEKDRIKTFVSYDSKLITMPVKVADRAELHAEVVADALLDTGSMVTVMSRRLAAALSLELEEGETMSGVGHDLQTKIALALAFPGNGDWYTFIRPRVIPNIYLGIDLIIGLDVLRRGDLMMKHQDNGTEVTFVFDERYFVNVRRDTVAEAYKKYQNVCAKFLIKDFL